MEVWAWSICIWGDELARMPDFGLQQGVVPVPLFDGVMEVNGNDDDERPRRHGRCFYKLLPCWHCHVGKRCICGHPWTCYPYLIDCGHR